MPQGAPVPDSRPLIMTIARFRKLGSPVLAFPPPSLPPQVDAGGAVIQVKLQAVRTSNTW